MGGDHVHRADAPAPLRTTAGSGLRARAPAASSRLVAFPAQNRVRHAERGADLCDAGGLVGRFRPQAVVDGRGEQAMRGRRFAQLRDDKQGQGIRAAGDGQQQRGFVGEGRERGLDRRCAQQ